MNVGITTAVEFLQKKGFVVEANPNTKITDEQFDLLKKEFSTDKVLKEKSERFLQERQTKERNKGSVAIEGYGPKETKAKTTEQKAVVSGDLRQKFTPLGKIDLNHPGKFKPIVEPVEEVESRPVEPVESESESVQEPEEAQAEQLMVETPVEADEKISPGCIDIRSYPD